jgi:hypothetical protein
VIVPTWDFSVVPPPYDRQVVAGWIAEEEFEPLGLVRVQTERSIWLLMPNCYQRLPRVERPRPREVSIEGRLDDATWHGLRRCWWVTYADGHRAIRILPASGPAEGVGVVSGVIEDIDGAWESLVDVQPGCERSSLTHGARLRHSGVPECRTRGIE